MNPDKIIIMTKMAIYDKYHGEKDRRIQRFFRHDYIYWSNFWTRLFALIGCGIIILFYIVDLIFIKNTEVLSINFEEEITKGIIFILIVLVIYTVVNSIIATRRYSASEARVKRQVYLTRRLDRLE